MTKVRLSASHALLSVRRLHRLGRQGRLTGLWESAVDTGTIERTLNQAFDPLH